MENKDFKKAFENIALSNGFEKYFGAWVKESTECVLALTLRKSNFSNSYYLRIKVNLRNAYGQIFEKSKEWIKHDVADILTGPSKDFENIFNLENEISREDRLSMMERLFRTERFHLTDKLLWRSGIVELYKTEEIFLLPAVKLELGLTSTAP